MEDENDDADVVDYYTKYKELKRRTKMLIYEHESFSEELRKSQQKLLKICRDKSFLLDRLLQYENVDHLSSSDSDLTDVSGDENAAGYTAPRRSRQQPLVTPMLPFSHAAKSGDLVTPVNSTVKHHKKKRGRPKKVKKEDSSSTGTGPSVTLIEEDSTPAAAADDAPPPQLSDLDRLDRHFQASKQTTQILDLGRITSSMPNDIFGDEDSSDSGGFC